MRHNQRSFEPIPINKINQTIKNTNTFKSQQQTTPRPNIIEHISVLGKPSKNGIGIMQQATNRTSIGIDTNQKIKQSKSLQVSDILPALKELELRVVKLSQAVLHHQQMLSQSSVIKQLDTSDSIQNISQLIKQQFQKHNNQLISPKTSFPTSSNQILVQISNLRTELLKQSKQKTILDRKYFVDILKKQTESHILNMYDANRQVFKRIQMDMNELRQLIQSNKQTNSLLSYFSSNRRFLDPKIIKYKQIVQRVENSINNSSQQCVLKSQPIILTTYYLDKDGYLLDNSFFYLIDNNGNNVKLEQNHINMLLTHKLLDSTQLSINKFQ